MLRRTSSSLAFALAAFLGCSSSSNNAPTTASTTTGTSTSTSTSTGATSSSAVAAEPDHGPPDAGTTAPAPTTEEIREPTFEEIVGILGINAGPCPSSMPAEARIRCAFDERYRGDSKSAGLAHELFVKWKIIAGVEAAHTMDGGYRGMIKIEPAVPLNADRKHIEWIVGSMRDFDQFFNELDTAATSRSITRTKSKPYRFKPIILRFMRSVAARTPSAYAHDWTVAWNLNGSLHTSADAVRETLFHEIFHLNDYAHPTNGADAWSLVSLNKTFDEIVKKCGTAIPCLTPYTPNDTIVRGGTYYSFQPGNGVREYAAELALRYYREQRAALRSLTPRPKPFKCGPPENAKSWAAMRDEFFAGIDVVPACP